jgi:hypothetical protein
MVKKLFIGLLAILLAAIPLAAAADTISGDRTADMMVDVVVVRPLGLLTTLAGVALTVVALPFTLPSGSVASSVQTLIVEPARYTFKRPLGEFEPADE